MLILTHMEWMQLDFIQMLKQLLRSGHKGLDKVQNLKCPRWVDMKLNNSLKKLYQEEVKKKK